MSILVSLLILLGSGGIAVPFDTTAGGPGVAVSSAAVFAPSAVPIADDTTAGGPGAK
jgi:hypothetical protein